MVYNVMGAEHGRRFVPLFLTQFVFILVMNLLGLLYLGSWGGTATANLAVTGGMAPHHADLDRVLGQSASTASSATGRPTRRLGCRSSCCRSS
jgi:hypothetical protein